MERGADMADRSSMPPDSPPPVGGGESGGIAPYVLVLLAGALLHGLTLLIYPARFPFLEMPIRDAAFWDAMARAPLPGAEPFHRPPGYALFLALVRAAGGTAPRAVPVVQALLVLFSTFLVMRSAARLFGIREAVLAGVMMVGSGAVYLFEMRLLPEALVLCLAACVVHGLLLAERDQPVPRNRGEERSLARSLADGASAVPLRGSARLCAGLAGAVAGYMAITRAEYLGALLLVVAVLCARAGRRTRPWALALLFAAGALVVVLPVTVHNFSHGAGNPVATSGGVSLYRANAAGAAVVPDPRVAAGGFSGYWLLESAEAESLAHADLGSVPAPGPAWGYWVSRAAREVAADPGRWVLSLAEKARVLIGRPVESHNLAYGLELDRIPVLRVASVPFNFLFLAALLGFFLAGGAGGVRTARGSRLAPAALVAAAVLSGVAFFPEADLRTPVLPVLTLFAAHALVRADLAWRAGRRRAVLLAAAAGVVLTGLTSIPRVPLRDPVREAQLFVEAGTGYLADSRRGEAGRAFHEALRLDDRNVNALIRLGQMAMEETELAEAIGWIEKAAVAAPADFSVHNNLGILYYQAQRLEDADRQMERAALLVPADPGPWYYRGLCRRKLGDLAMAESFFLESLARDPGFVGAYVRLIEVLLDQGRDAEARQWADRAGANGVAMPKETADRLR